MSVWLVSDDLPYQPVACWSCWCFQQARACSQEREHESSCSVRCWFYQVNWCRSCFFNRQCWRQTETVKQMSYQQKVCIQVVGDSLSVHCQPLQAVLCAAFAVKSARHCNVFPLFAVDFQHIGHKQMESRKSCIAWLSPFDLILHTPSRGCVVACLACI